MPFLDASRKHGYSGALHADGEPHVTAYSIAEAKSALAQLIDRALNGEHVIITRHGKPVAELRPVKQPPAPLLSTYEWLRSRRDARPGVDLTSVEILDELDETNGR
jgi:prevent-host-death family protein